MGTWTERKNIMNVVIVNAIMRDVMLATTTTIASSNSIIANILFLLFALIPLLLYKKVATVKKEK